MSIKISFEGRFQREFSNVTPHDIIIEGKHLYVKKHEIPCKETRIWDLFSLLEKETRHQYGELFITFSYDGDIKYCSKTSNDAVDYGLGRIFGSRSLYWQYLSKFTHSIPKDDTYYMGRYEDEVEYL